MSFDTRYRPIAFKDVVGQKGTIQVLKKLIQQKQVFGKSYIFAGPSGTGKTTTARILARAMLCEHVDAEGEPCNQCDTCKEIIEGTTSFSFVEMDAANNSGVDTIRQIVEGLEYHTLGGKDRKIYLIDECFTEDTEVMTTEGLKSIKVLVDERYSGKVLSFDPETQENVWKSVTDWFEIPDERETLKLTFDTGTELIVTVDQEIYTINRGWVKACALNEEDEICETSFSDVILPALENGQIPCMCGCGKEIPPKDTRGRRKRFYSWHGNVMSKVHSGPRVDWHKKAKVWNESAPNCACGCGIRLSRTPKQMREGLPDSKTVQGHNNRRIKVKPFTKDELAVIYGTLLGDTSITRPHPTAHPRLAFNHSSKQRGYANHKAKTLKRLGWHVKDTISQGYSKGDTLVSGTTSCNPYLEEVWEKVRNTEGKRVTQEWLDQLTDQSLAFWYMDDGSLGKYKGNPSYVTLHTEGFTQDENNLIAEYLRCKGFLDTTVSKSKEYFYIYIPRQGCTLFLETVKPYIHTSMKYKVG